MNLLIQIAVTRGPAAHSDDTPFWPFLVVGVGLVLAVNFVGKKFSSRKSFHEHFRRYLGRKYQDLETHDKIFPGYDLASVHRALASILAEECEEVRAVGGGISGELRHLFREIKSMFPIRQKPTTPTYERVPVDVETEESFAINQLWLAQVKRPIVKDASADDVLARRFAILLSARHVENPYADAIEGERVHTKVLSLSIACKSRALADWFYTEFDRRRKRLNVYRGKLIDPVVGSGGISSIGFRAIKKVEDEDLVLTGEVRSLLRGAIVEFYRHREQLRAVGVEMKRGVLLHGPPGTGKTSISLYLAGLLPEFTICFVSGRQLLYPRELCRMARYLQPTMIVFEDIDLIAEQRDTNGLATVLGELMNQIDGCEPDEEVLFVMNTNSLERLEAAVRNRPGRVDQIITIPLPDAGMRERLIRYFARTVGIADEDLGPVVRLTDGATPAALKEIVKRATVGAVERMNGEMGKIRLKQSDLVLAVKQVESMRETQRARVTGFAG